MNGAKSIRERGCDDNHSRLTTLLCALFVRMLEILDSAESHRKLRADAQGLLVELPHPT